ncbi:MAG: SDR family oxidoreductase [Candidatus Methanosuratincola sp.]|jgi:UDP-glucose 4-epimerase|nr:SDR family oxidoreductase [Candidatus Methanosuratincola sp.]
MRRKKVVVTGGAGFIGSNLSAELCKDNEVTIVDNFSTGKEGNIKDLIDSGCARLLRGSVTDLEAMKAAFKGADYVFHEAAIPSVPRSVADPMRTNDAGVTGTLAVLVAARDCGIEKVVFASSSSVYGETESLPKKEDMVCMPMSPYAVTKLAGEHYCRVFTELYGLGTVALRYFNVYGPMQDPGSEYAAVVPKFIDCALKGEAFPIHGDGLQSRDFTFVRDVVRANLMAAESKSTGVYNIGGGRRTTVLELAQAISEVVGFEMRAVHLPPRPGDVRDSWADISKAKRDFGFEPAFTLREGISETVAWFRRCLGTQG